MICFLICTISLSLSRLLHIINILQYILLSSHHHCSKWCRLCLDLISSTAAANAYAEQNYNYHHHDAAAAMCMGGNERFILAKFNEFFRQSRLWWALQQLDGVLGWLKWGRHKIPPHDVKRKLSILGRIWKLIWVCASVEALWKRLIFMKVLTLFPDVFDHRSEVHKFKNSFSLVVRTQSQFNFSLYHHSPLASDETGIGAISTSLWFHSSLCILVRGKQKHSKNDKLFSLI